MFSYMYRLSSSIHLRALSVLLALVMIGSPSLASAQSWAERASFYKRDVISESRAEFGINAPVPLFAAQIHQESLWKKDAKSKYANGLTQFTPATEAWIKTVYPRALGHSNSMNPQWAIRAMIKYDNWLYQRMQAIDTCNRWAFTLAAYNGGIGWISRDKKLTIKKGQNSQIWWGNVENHSTRATWAFNENRGYPTAIIYKHQQKYEHWGGKTICL